MTHTVILKWISILLSARMVWSGPILLGVISTPFGLKPRRRGPKPKGFGTQAFGLG